MRYTPKLRWIAWLLCAVLWTCNGSEEAGKDTTASTAADSTAADSTRIAEAVPVETAPATSGDISSFLSFNSTLETEAAVEIYPRIGGLVEALEGEEGDWVASGDTLLRINDDELRLAFRESEVNLHHLEAGFERTQEMFQRQLVSEQDYENAKLEIEQARLGCQKARLALEHTRVCAPFSGVIAERHVQVGSRVEPGTRLFALVKLDEMLARVFVPGQHLTSIRTGQKAIITSDFLEDRRFAGWVKRISPVVDPKSGTFKVTVGIEASQEHLRPGIFVNVEIVTDTHENAVLVPKEAVVYDGGDRYVFVVEGTTASRVKLDAGFENSRFIEALSLIQPDTPIIVVGQNGLKDKARVKIVNQEDHTLEAGSPEPDADQG
jgi:membrane fusion protein (multidrug efflux system)